MTTPTGPRDPVDRRVVPTDLTGQTNPADPTGRIAPTDPSGRTGPRGSLRSPAAATAVLLGALVLLGCSGADGATAGLEPTLELDVVGTDHLEFIPDAYAVPAGDAVELVLRSEPAVEHDLVVEGAGNVGSAFDQGEHDHEHDDADQPPAADLHVAHALAGEQARSLFTISEPGVYDVYCSIPGHREAGMVATLEVVD